MDIRISNKSSICFQTFRMAGIEDKTFERLYWAVTLPGLRLNFPLTAPHFSGIFTVTKGHRVTPLNGAQRAFESIMGVLECWSIGVLKILAPVPRSRRFRS